MKKTTRNAWLDRWEAEMQNQDLKHRYNLMHKEGKSAWFDSGDEERQAILKMGQPWRGLRVLEIGCGEGDLLEMINNAGAITTGIDYSLEAITTANNRYPHLDVKCCDWDEFPEYRWSKIDVVVMQGVLEHMDDWRAALDGMIAKFKPSTVITSMPCFINVRGIIWHTLDMLGAVMSKTDLHYIDPWEVEEFACILHDAKFKMTHIDSDWGNGVKMLEDLKTRIPLAIKDGGIPWDSKTFGNLLVWLENIAPSFRNGGGAVAIYRIDI